MCVCARVRVCACVLYLVFFLFVVILLKTVRSSDFFLFERRDEKRHFLADPKRLRTRLHLRRKESMSDDEFAELKKKKKKSKKVDFDAFEEDGASAGKDGVAAATEKIEDLDRTFFVW